MDLRSTRNARQLQRTGYHGIAHIEPTEEADAARDEEEADEKKFGQSEHSRGWTLRFFQ